MILNEEKCCGQGQQGLPVKAVRRNTRGRRKSPGRLGFAVEAAGAEETDGLVFSRLILETHNAPTATRAARRPTGSLSCQHSHVSSKTKLCADSILLETRLLTKYAPGLELSLTFTGVQFRESHEQTTHAIKSCQEPKTTAIIDLCVLLRLGLKLPFFRTHMVTAA